MKTKLYSYRDKLVGFGPIMVENNESTAVRGFSYAVNASNGMMGFAPTDYDLYYIGDFDTENGIISAADIPYHVVNGESVYGDEE